MDGLDIHFPVSGYNTVKSYKNFTIVYPWEQDVSMHTDITSIVRLIVWEDDTFQDLIEKRDIPTDKLKIQDIAYYDIEYIRDCTLRKVIKDEWRTNWGPTSAEKWLQSFKEDSLDRYVRVVCFTRPKYSLKEFNKLYTHNA